jgi:enoyl-CoA hydratase
MFTALRPANVARSTMRQYVRAMSTQAEPLVLASRSESGKVAILQLNRPKALNALSSPLFDTVFAAGADIKEMKDKEFSDAYKNNFLGTWGKVASIRKPIVGAVAGYAVSTCAPRASPGHRDNLARGNLANPSSAVAASSR